MSQRPVESTDAQIEVVLCAFNGETYIRQQVESILRQTLKPKRLSIYDDASTDRTREVLQEIIGLNSSGVDVVLHANPRNLGYVKNFEQGIRSARLDYIALCDQDDLWDEDKLAVLFSAFDADTGVVFSNALLVDERAVSLRHTLWEAIRFTRGRQASLVSRGKARRVLLKQNYVTGAALMMRRGLTQALPPFPLAAPHDYWIAIIAAETSKLKPVDRVLYKYRQHSANVIGQAPYSLSRRVVAALRQADARYRKELETYEQIACALQGLPGLELASEGFSAKAAFLRARAEAIASRWRGLARLVVMLGAGEYGRFCRVGMAMFVKDVSVLVARCLRGEREC